MLQKETELKERTLQSVNRDLEERGERQKRRRGIIVKSDYERQGMRERERDEKERHGGGGER